MLSNGTFHFIRKFVLIATDAEQRNVSFITCNKEKRKKLLEILVKACLSWIKIKTLDTVKKRKIICWDTAEKTKIGKTQAANLIKNQPQLRNEYEKF